MKYTKIILHGIACLYFLGAVFGFGGWNAEYVTQQTVIALWQIKFILIALYFELLALGVEK